MRLMDFEGMDGDCPGLLSSKRVSFRLFSGSHKGVDFDGFPATPETPIFKSDFVHGILGTRNPVIDVPSSLSSIGIAPSSLLARKQVDLVSPGKILAQPQLCCGDVFSAKSDSLGSVGVFPADLEIAGDLNLGGLERKLDAIGCSLGLEGLADASGLHQKSDADTLLSSGASPVDKKSDSQIRVRPSSEAKVERSEKYGDKPLGRSWSSVVTQSPFGVRLSCAVGTSRGVWSMTVIADGRFCSEFELAVLMQFVMELIENPGVC